MNPGSRSATVLVLSLLVYSSVDAATNHAPSFAPIPEEQLLSVGVEVFDPGLEKTKFFAPVYEMFNPEVRESEAIFVAVKIMRALQETGRFGMVRVTPHGSPTVDVIVSGRLHTSTSTLLALDLEVTDATGQRWYKKRYKSRSNSMAYLDYIIDSDTPIEPYQHIYNAIARDLTAAQEKRSEAQLAELREIADLRFAAELAPAIFGDYLRTDRRGRLALGRAPSLDDPMMARMRDIQLRDEFFLDLLTERYEGFSVEMDEPYDHYRAVSYEIESDLRHALREANLASMPKLDRRGQFPERSGWSLRRANSMRSRARAQARYLSDMASSFSVVMEPLLVELDGATLRLEGTIDDQYREWRQLLVRIFETETGLLVSSSSSELGPTAGN